MAHPAGFFSTPLHFLLIGFIPVFFSIVSGLFFFNYVGNSIVFALYIAKLIFIPIKKHKWRWQSSLGLHNLITMTYQIILLLVSRIADIEEVIEFNEASNPFLIIIAADILFVNQYYLESVFSQSLAWYRYFRMDKDAKCGICLEPFVAHKNPQLVMIGCGHLFHLKCLNQYDNANKNNHHCNTDKCAKCRYAHKYRYLWTLFSYQACFHRFIANWGVTSSSSSSTNRRANRSLNSSNNNSSNNHKVAKKQTCKVVAAKAVVKTQKPTSKSAVKFNSSSSKKRCGNGKKIRIKNKTKYPKSRSIAKAKTKANVKANTSANVVKKRVRQPSPSPSPSTSSSSSSLSSSYDVVKPIISPLTPPVADNRIVKKLDDADTSESESESDSSLSLPDIMTPFAPPVQHKACAQCTFLNAVSAIQCKMCHHVLSDELKQKTTAVPVPKPIVQKKEETKVETVKVGWQCMRCYKYNVYDDVRCAACQKAKLSVSGLFKMKMKKKQKSRQRQERRNAKKWVPKQQIVASSSPISKPVVQPKVFDKFKRPNRIVVASRDRYPLYVYNKHVPRPPRRQPPAVPEIRFFSVEDDDEQQQSRDRVYNHNVSTNADVGVGNWAKEEKMANVDGDLKVNVSISWNPSVGVNKSTSKRLLEEERERDYLIKHYKPHCQVQSSSKYEAMSRLKRRMQQKRAQLMHRVVTFQIGDFVYFKCRKCKIICIDGRIEPVLYTVKYLDDGHVDVTEQKYLSIVQTKAI